MKNKKIILTGLMSLAITFGSTTMMIHAENANSITAPVEERDCQPHKAHMIRGREIFDKSVDELKKSGVLDDNDVKKIEEYNTKKMEEMRKKRHSRIDEMVEQNVITKEKGEKLKTTIDKNIEAERKVNDK